MPARATKLTADSLALITLIAWVAMDVWARRHGTTLTDLQHAIFAVCAGGSGADRVKKWRSHASSK